MAELCGSALSELGRLSEGMKHLFLQTVIRHYIPVVSTPYAFTTKLYARSVFLCAYNFKALSGGTQAVLGVQTCEVHLKEKVIISSVLNQGL